MMEMAGMNVWFEFYSAPRACLCGKQEVCCK